LLREAVSDLNEETTAAEKKQIAALASSQPDWQHRLARLIAGRTAPDPAPVSWWSRWRMTPRLGLVTVAVAVLAVVGYRLGYDQIQVFRTQKLLASAYTEQRTLIPRMRGAQYSAFNAQRGASESLLGRPVSLMKAETLIASGLKSHPSNAEWMHAKGRADLLDGKYDAAAESLRRALQLSPKSPEILTDLATASFQMGDFSAAFESLSQVLAIKPNDPVALFNRAIVGEQLHLYRQALDDTERYLQIDPQSEWAPEARARADSITGKLKRHDQSHATPLLAPTRLASAAVDASLRTEVDQRIEEYLHDAVSAWLPRAYPATAGASADASAKQALFFLADLTSQQHNDRWLSDLLQGSSSADFPAAAAALARAVKANEVGEYDTATEQSVRARRLFRASGNVAGGLGAEFEEIFAAQLSRRSENCWRQAGVSLRESEKHSYPWLHIQLGLEESVCSGLMGDLGMDEKADRRAMERAQRNGYGNLYLRALGFAVNDRFDRGDQPGAWKLADTGLERYWSGQFSAMRGYNLYHALGSSDDAARQPNLQVAIWREAVALIGSNEDQLLQAWAHSYLAQAATAAHQPQLAGQQYAEAARLVELAPQSDASRSYSIETEIRIARLEAGLGRFDAAIVRLTSIQDQLRPLTNNYLVQMFYSTLGEVQLRIQRAPEAEQALRPALALAEQNLASLGSDAERASWSQEATSVYLALTEAELMQSRSQEALEMYEWYLGASQRAGTNPHSRKALKSPPLPVPSGLATRLPLLSRETVLAYGLLPDGLAIWIYDDRGVHAQWNPKPARDLQELVARFRELSSDPKSELSALRRDARTLYQILIAPVESQLVPGRTLVIEAEGELAGLPFEALLDANDHYLTERWPIVHSLGQDSQERLRGESDITPDLPALVVGSTASSPADGLIPLLNVALEVDTVAKGFRSATVLKGEKATLPAVTGALPAAAVFHFAGHSLFTHDKTGLLLASGTAETEPQSLLDADSLRRLQLKNMRLAVLSACSTAAGSGGSRGFSSVNEALLRAGVPHVVASRWAVDSVSVTGFVEDFYRNALSGQPVSDAVRLTARKMMANPRTAHPYYWSAFAAYGRP
jgi:CHAT domain-containing protein